jgi:hypothetical protein
LAGTTFDNAGTLAFSGKNQVMVRAQTGATFINDAGGAITGQPHGTKVVVESGDTFQEGAGTVAPMSSRPDANPGVVVDGGTLAYTANAASSIEVEDNAMLVGDVPANALLAIGCAASGPVFRTSSLTNAGFIGLYGPSDGDCSNSRTLSVDSGAGPGTGTLTNTGRIEGYGMVAGNVSNTSGSILPGDSLGGCNPVCSAAYSAGRITVGGGYTQGPAGTLRVINPACSCAVIFTPPRSTPYSQLAVHGNASLDGTLEMITPVGSTPNAGNALQVLTAGSVTRRFASLAGQLASSGTVSTCPSIARRASRSTSSDIPSWW